MQNCVLSVFTYRFFDSIKAIFCIKKKQTANGNAIGGNGEKRQWKEILDCGRGPRSP